MFKEGYMKNRLVGRHLSFVLMMFLSFAVLAGPAMCEDLPKENETLPDMDLIAPAAESDRQYLGISESAFKLRHVKADVMVVEVLGVYCPYCYEQAPLFRNLFNRLQDGKLKDKVKMFGVAAGATAMEVEYLREQGQYNYPIVEDPQYSVHKLLGEPKTPFTMIVDKEGKVLFAHQGIIRDIDSFYSRIGELAE